MTILPGKRKNKQIREMRAPVVPSGEIFIIGGIVGTILERDGKSPRICIDKETGAAMRIVIYAVQSICTKFDQA